MTHTVTLTVELTVDAQETNNSQDIEGIKDSCYWLLQSHLESNIGNTLDRGVIIKDFNIEINN